MIQSARRVVQQYLSGVEERGVVIEEEDAQETARSAFGNSSGIM